MNFLGKTAIAVLRVLGRPAVWIPALIMLAGTILFAATDLDTALLRPYFSDNPDAATLAARWPQRHSLLWRWLYDWGVYPARVLGVGGLAVWLAGAFWSKLERWRKPGLFFALMLLLGPGILVNGLKPCWMRPRPHATVTFGGPRDFHPVWQRGSCDEDASFPCGHASMGFFLMAPAFIIYRRRPWLAAAFMLLGVAGGVTMGLARMAVGCHFPSDILWSGGLVYYAGLALAVPFKFGKDETQEHCVQQQSPDCGDATTISAT